MTEPGAAPLDVLDAYRVAGRASAAAGEAVSGVHRQANVTRAAFFDVDNTILRGASIFHFAVGLARRQFFSPAEVAKFALKQVKFILSGSEDLEDMASATEAALSFVEGRDVASLVAVSEAIFDSDVSDKLIPGSLALAREHLDAGDQVWLVTATPVELATLIAQRLGLTGALGTVAEIEDGRYTGRLVGAPLHGLAKAEAVRAIADREGLDLSQCSAYSDSINDVPMLSLVGRPYAINPDRALRRYAKDRGWSVRDFRARAKVMQASVPIATGATALAVGVAVGYAAGRVSRRR